VATIARILPALLLAASAVAEEVPFALSEVPGPGRIALAEIADLDGDGRGDLLCVSIRGMPPDEQREIRAHFQGEGGLPAEPSWTAPLPGGAAAYDLADLDDRTGAELILLRRDRLTLLSLAERRASWRDVEVGAPTLAAASDERGLDRLRIARGGLGPSPRLLVPGLGETLIFTPGGELVGRPRVGARANFFVPPRPGPLIAESEMELYFDHPRLSTGDVDGDGRGDLIASNRHELRIFLQREDGRFPSEADRQIGLGLLSLDDHLRRSGSVRIEPIDFDDDGRVDLLVSNSTGSLFSADTEVSIHMNRGGAWNLEDPDQVFHTEGGMTTNGVTDLDGDGHPELMSARIPTGILEVVEMLLTRSIDAEVRIYKRDGEKPFGTEPWMSWKTGLGVSFETFRARGFLPSIDADLNGDGRRDLVTSGGGEALEVRLLDPERGFGRPAARQELETNGRIRFGRLDADDLDDWLLYDPRQSDRPIRVGVNRGVLPGTVRGTVMGASH
jgi:hypothetical protein